MAALSRRRRYAIAGYGKWTDHATQVVARIRQLGIQYMR
jgi:hypothetical protein